MTTKAAPLSAGMAAKKTSKDPSEPADPPSPTTGMPEEPPADSAGSSSGRLALARLALGGRCVKPLDF